MSSEDSQIRLSVTLSGGASLGAYHAGVLAALITAVQSVSVHEPGRVRVDAIGGASAGALAAMFGAHALLNGLDAVELLYQAWVERVNLDMLRARGTRAPLGFAQLRRRLPHDLALEHWDRVPAGPQRTPLGLHVSLTGLRGLRYNLRTADDRVIPAVTYADWGEFVLAPEGGVEQLLRPQGASVIDFVLASAANPGAFAPELLDRTDDRDAFDARGIEELPAGGRLWYTDGSSISSEPLGRVLTLANKLGRTRGSATHVHLMIDPLSELPEENRAWSEDGSRPSWLASVARTLEIMPEQVLHDDLRRVQHVNRRFQRVDELTAALAGHLDAEAVSALQDLLGDDADGDDPHALLARALRGVAGLEGKLPVHLDLISPLILANDHDRVVPAMLAGEVMGDFGGFIHERLRRSDFALGYDCMLAWLPGGLEAAGLAPATIAAVTDTVRAARRDEWTQVDASHVRITELPWRSQLGLARLALHTLRVLGTDVWRALRP